MKDKERMGEEPEDGEWLKEGLEVKTRVGEEPEREESACYCIRLRRAANAVTKLYDSQLKAAGLTLNQYSLLSNLFRLQPASVTELANAVKLERTTVTRNIRPLFEMGLIQDLSEDGERDRRMRLTETGLARREECARRWSCVQQRLEETLGAERLEAFLETARVLEELK